MRLKLDRRPSPIGEMLVAWDPEGRLRVLDFADFEPRMRELLRLQYGEVALERAAAPDFIVRPIDRYFSGDLPALDEIDVATGGTEFQKQVWAALRALAPGETTSYGDLAKRIGRASAVRAVGGANGANPIAIVVPCHRVIGAGGKLTGYGGGLRRKAWLLAHETGRDNSFQADMFAGR